MRRQGERPPRLAAWLIHRLAFTLEETSLIGDLNEEYRMRLQESSRFRARLWYWRQILTSCPSFITQSLTWSFVMFNNYLKIALRSLKKHKAYSFINIAGLAIGITCSVFMLMWVQNELSYDRFHQNAGEIHRILLDPREAATTHEAVSPPVLAGTMKEAIPEVVNATRIAVHGQLLFTFDSKSLADQKGLLADPSFFEMFDFPFVQGDPTAALTEVRSLVLTETTAAKFFGGDNPVGKTITVNNQEDYRVTGVIADVPSNSHLQFDFVRPFELLRESGRDLESWGDVSYYTYVQLQKGSSFKTVNGKLKELIERKDPSHNMYYLQPLSRIHLHSNFNFDLASHGNIIYIYIFGAAALFILLIACINFMNLATARSGIRAKEVGMRKVIGAKKSDIIKQFFGESILSALLSLALALSLIKLLLPAFNELSGKALVFDLAGSTELIAGLVAIAVFTGVLSGSYPALFLSSFHPIRVIRGTVDRSIRGTHFRRILVVVQFSLTIILIIGTLVVHEQMDHIRTRDLGYDKEFLAVFPVRGNMNENFETFKNELLRNPGIVNVTGTSSLPTHIGSGTSGAWWEGKAEDVRVQMQLSAVDYDYLDTFKMEMVQGRFFSRDHPSESRAVVLNETAVKAMGMDSPIGKGFKSYGTTGPIIGVVKDFHYKSLRTEIEPLYLIMDPRGYRYAVVRIEADNTRGAMAFIEDTWKRFAPDFPFEFSFLDERIDNLYRAEQRMGQVFNTFTVLAIFVACLGLFGMASFTAERRTREIGIRKVLGASVSSVLVLLSKESTRLILISNIIAWPVAYVVMNRWLQGFAYRTSINIWIFILSAAAAWLIAMLMVGIQSLKAALANPSDSLRYQ